MRASGSSFGEPEVFRRNTELRAQAPHLILGETLIVRVIRQWCERSGLVAPEVVDPGHAPRSANVGADAAQDEAIAAGGLNEFPQPRHLGEGRRQGLGSLRLCDADLRRLHDNTVTIEFVGGELESGRGQWNLRVLEPVPKPPGGGIETA